MSLVLITGISGLVGSSAAEFFSSKGFDIVGIDNNRREFFFGSKASTLPMRDKLVSNLKKKLKIYDVDIRNIEEINRIFRTLGNSIDLVIHSAAQPSHDWAATNINEDFTINANGTLAILNASFENSPNSVFIHLSTNKVYGDYPNDLVYDELEFRFSPKDDKLKNDGFSESTPVDNVLHSFFGVSKLAGDLLVQEFGKNFGYQATVLRGGCLTGPSHAGVEAHGFLSYLVNSLKISNQYKIIGYGGKQVRDNIHSHDLSSAFFEIYKNPTLGEIFNIGGGKYSNCSVLEAINIFQEFSGKQANLEFVNTNRVGDHKWWISDLSKFKTQYPNWKITLNIKDIIKDIMNS